MAKGLIISNAEPLSKRTTIKLGGLPIARVLLENQSGLDDLPAALERLGGSHVVLGRGSNIIAHDGALPLVIVELGEAFFSRQPEVLAGNRTSVTLRVGAATPLQLLLNRLVSMGLGGLTGLAGIPGQVGGSLAMNAGSFGDVMSSCLASVYLFSPMLGNVTLKAEELNLAYRHFSVPALLGTESDQNAGLPDAAGANAGSCAGAKANTELNANAGSCAGAKANAELNANASKADDAKASPQSWFIIHSAEFTCRRQPSNELLTEISMWHETKQASQPLGAASAGCVFKNPDLAPAGKLLDEAGLKGYGKGGMSFSLKHANFMVNDGTGSSKAAFDLIDEAQYRVKERFGVDLKLEVRIWP